jgi:2Fe-2S ferredoxin
VKDTISVTIIDREGVEHTIEAPTDMNLHMMGICRMNDIWVKIPVWRER